MRIYTERNDTFDALLMRAWRGGQDLYAPASARGLPGPGDLASQDCSRNLTKYARKRRRMRTDDIKSNCCLEEENTYVDDAGRLRISSAYLRT